MKKHKQKRRDLWLPLYSIVLAAFTLYILLDAFVIPRTYAVVGTGSTSSATSSTVASSSSASSSAESSSTSSESDSSSSSTASSSSTDSSSSEATVTLTDSYYSDGSTTIEITTYEVDNTTVYVADITLSDVTALQTAFANATYGKNITATTSSIADSVGAILAVNGDYYSSRDGYVIRNGVLYRDSTESSDQEDFVLYSDGSAEIITEGDITAEELLANGAWQVLSFGPGLVENGEIAVSTTEEVSQAKTSNPRTAIGVISPLHYVLVVADGRTSESAGLSLYELADFMCNELGCETAYNLDGGGSSTMVFNGTVINNPTSNGKTIEERKVSDIVCIV